MKSPILGGSAAIQSTNAAANRTVNLFPELTEDGKEPAYLQRCPGLAVLATVGTGPIRGTHTAGGFLFAVSGTALYRLTTAYTPTLVSSGLMISQAQVVMASSATEVFLACGTRGYVYNIAGGTLAEVTDPDFPGAQTVAYLDGYFVFNPPDSQEVWVTDLLDGTAIDALDFASAETEADNLLAVVVDPREAWLFGETTTEVWYNAAGGSGFPLARIQGASIQVGIASSYAWAQMDNTIIWLGNDGIVYRANGYVPQRVSNHAVENWIVEDVTLGSAIAYSYKHKGHQFFVLTFTDGNSTWAFDVATGKWHERPGWVNGEFSRHRSNCYARFNGLHVVGDYENGNLYSLSHDAYADNDAHQRWVRTWRALPPGNNDLKRQTHHSLQVDFEAGVGLDGTGQGTDPEVMLRWSNDGGHNWSNELWRPIGKIGETGQRAIWRRLGDTDRLRDRIYELSGTDPVRIAIMGAELDVEVKNA